MVAAPLRSFAFAEESVRTIWVGVAGVWVFSWYWFAKTYELAKVSMIEPPSGPSPKVRRKGGRLEIVRTGIAGDPRGAEKPSDGARSST
jgi:hypothetical protein